MELTLRQAAFMGPVLERATRAVGSASGLDLDGIADAVAVGECMARHAVRSAPEAPLRVELSPSDGALAMAFLFDDAEQARLARRAEIIPGGGPFLEAMAGSVHAVPDDGSGRLAVRVGSAPPSAA